MLLRGNVAQKLVGFHSARTVAEEGTDFEVLL